MAMEAGKNVICEKPLEIQLDRIDRMIEAAREEQGPPRRDLPEPLERGQPRPASRPRSRGPVRPDRLGGMLHPLVSRPTSTTADGGWRGTWKLDGGGAIMNQSVHAIDLLQWIVGPVKQVSAYAASRIHAKIEVEDTLSCSLQFENGAFGTIVGTTAMYPGSPVRIEVGGENGTAVYRVEPQDLEIPRGAAGRQGRLLERINGSQQGTTGGGSSATDVPADLHAQNLHHILSAWEAGKDADTCGPEARKAVAIILAMYESARNNGAPVMVK